MVSGDTEEKKRRVVAMFLFLSDKEITELLPQGHTLIQALGLKNLTAHLIILFVRRQHKNLSVPMPKIVNSAALNFI